MSRVFDGGRTLDVGQRVGDLMKALSDPILNNDLSRMSAYSGDSGIHVGADSEARGRHDQSFEGSAGN